MQVIMTSFYSSKLFIKGSNSVLQKSEKCFTDQQESPKIFLSVKKKQEFIYYLCIIFLGYLHTKIEVLKKDLISTILSFSARVAVVDRGQGRTRILNQQAAPPPPPAPCCFCLKSCLEKKPIFSHCSGRHGPQFVAHLVLIQDRRKRGRGESSFHDTIDGPL